MVPLLVFGSINLDVSIPVPRLPALGETLIGGAAELAPGGKGANQAHAARLFGAEVALVGAIGDDAFGEPALNRRAHSKRWTSPSSTGWCSTRPSSRN